MPSDFEEYEIQVMKDGRWNTEAVRNSETLSRQLAKELLGNKQCAGVRIVGNQSYRDGTTNETVIFEKTQDVNGDKPIKINTVEVANPRCKRPRDFFGLEGRMVFNRIFRNHLESVALTPTEILHSFQDIKRLQDRDNLVPSAVSHVAKLQTANTDQTLRDRQDEIYGIVEQIVEQARRADDMELPPLANSFSATLKDVADFRGETPEYLGMVVLARDLSGVNSWTGKLDRLCQLADPETDRKAILLLDVVIADVLGANIVQELLGWKRSLGAAIIAMLDLADGTFDPEESEITETTAMLCKLFSANALPASRRVMIDRALTQLKSSQPLSRNDPEKELEEYRRVMARLLVPGGIMSGGDAAEAITLRGTRFIEQGGATGRKKAINATVKTMPDPARGVMYLAELSNTNFADEHLEDIVEQLGVVFSARVIDELCRRSMSPKNRMVTATGAHDAALNSGLPEGIRDQVTEHIDGVLERYLLEENIIDKLDKPEDHIRDRAVRLVKFCGAGVLPADGEALSLARQRVIALLRKPKFDTHYIEGIGDAAKAEKALRDFHKLLIGAGIA